MNFLQCSCAFFRFLCRYGAFLTFGTLLTLFLSFLAYESIELYRLSFVKTTPPGPYLTLLHRGRLADIYAAPCCYALPNENGDNNRWVYIYIKGKSRTFGVNFWFENSTNVRSIMCLFPGLVHGYNTSEESVLPVAQFFMRADTDHVQLSLAGNTCLSLPTTLGGIEQIDLPILMPRGKTISLPVNDLPSPCAFKHGELVVKLVPSREAITAAR